MLWRSRRELASLRGRQCSNFHKFLRDLYLAEGERISWAENHTSITVHRQAFSEHFAEIKTRNSGNKEACTEFIPF